MTPAPRSGGCLAVPVAMPQRVGDAALPVRCGSLVPRKSRQPSMAFYGDTVGVRHKGRIGSLRAGVFTAVSVGAVRLFLPSDTANPQRLPRASVIDQVKRFGAPSAPCLGEEPERGPYAIRRGSK